MTSLNELVRSDAPLSYGASAVYKRTAALELKYRFTSNFGDEVLLHRADGPIIHLPRALCPVGGEDKRSWGTKVVFPDKPKLREHQVPMVKGMLDVMRQGMSGVLLAGTGQGKTPMAMYLTAEMQTTTLVVVTKDDLYGQWIAQACGEPTLVHPEGINFLGLTRDEVGEIRGPKCNVAGKKLVVAMIHSLAKHAGYPGWIYDYFGLVIFDEVHRMPAETFGKVADQFSARLRLGLSANDKRADGKEVLIHAHIGPVRVKGEAQLLVPRVLRRDTGWRCPRIIDKTLPGKHLIRIPHEHGKTTHIEKVMAADGERNAWMAAAIKEVFDAGRRIVAFGTLHEHLHTMQRALVKAGVPAKEIGLYIGATTKAEKEAREKVKARRVILTTYGMMGEATDIPWLDTALWLVPRANVEQATGRIRREHDEKKFPVVIDPVDRDSPVFVDYAEKRLKWYLSIGAEVVEVE